MKHLIGIRREDKNEWERRVPLIPADLKIMNQEQDIGFVVQPSDIRIFIDHDYCDAGAEVEEDLSPCQVVVAVKEIPLHLFEAGRTYVFFAHVIKGQEHNMPMLKQMMKLKCNLIDYEKITDEKGRRMIFFGRFAGLAGMIDTFWALGRQLKLQGVDSPFEHVDHTYRYKSLSEAKKAIHKAGEYIQTEGISPRLAPFILGVTGYGNVAKGAQEIIAHLPVIRIKPEEIPVIAETRKDDIHHIYEVVFKEQDMVEPIVAGARFDLQDYYQNPENYKSKMERFLPHVTMLVNCIYWDTRYPRILTKKFLSKYFTECERPVLRVVGDISCDVDGAIECTSMVTKPDKPALTYNPLSHETSLGVKSEGVVIVAVDNLPCELPRESSTEFSHVLKDFIPALATADYTENFETCQLPDPIRKAMILYHGELTPNYKYIQRYL